MKRFVIFFLLVSLVCLGVWAKGGNELDDSCIASVTGVEWQPIGALQVDPTKEIISIFEANGVSGKYLTIDRDLQFISSNLRDDIETIIDDDEDDVVSLIKEHMMGFLKEDKTEYVYMLLGTIKFCATLEDDSHLFSSTKISWYDIGELQVGPTKEIISIFEANGVDGKYLAMNRKNEFIPSDVRDDIEAVIDDDEDDVVDLIKKHMMSFIEEDKTEFIQMVLGPKKFCAVLDDDSFKFVSVKIDWQSTGSLQIGPNAKIVYIFEENGIDGKYLAMNRENEFIPSDVRDDIETVIDDDEDDVVALIKEDMRSYLEEDKIEYVYMLLGTKMFSVALNQ